jgi:hypothetical protein
MCISWDARCDIFGAEGLQLCANTFMACGASPNLGVTDKYRRDWLCAKPISLVPEAPSRQKRTVAISSPSHPKYWVYLVPLLDILQGRGNLFWGAVRELQVAEDVGPAHNAVGHSLQGVGFLGIDLVRRDVHLCVCGGAVWDRQAPRVKVAARKIAGSTFFSVCGRLQSAEMRVVVPEHPLYLKLSNTKTAENGRRFAP